VAGHGAAHQRAHRQIYGLRYASTLYGIVFFGHQIGAFIGVWLGGYVFETTDRTI